MSTKGKDLKEALEKYGAEYKSEVSENPYTFSSTNHEGFNVLDMRLLSMDRPLVNDYVFGDVPWLK